MRTRRADCECFALAVNMFDPKYSPFGRVLIVGGV